MFYAVLALLQKFEKQPRKHSGVIALFDAEFVKKEIFPIEFSKHFHRAFELRQVSDYHASEPVRLEDVDELIENAASFVRGIEKYLTI
jgi:uncharacterized protein